MITLDAARMTERVQAHRYLKEALSLPEHYGENLDALYDCLTDLGETEIHFVNLDSAKSYFNRLLPVFREAAEENRMLHLSYD